MNEDQWRNQQLNKYLDYEECSNCCGSSLIDETDICMECNEHCTVVSLEDFRREEKENYLIDKADMERSEV